MKVTEIFYSKNGWPDGPWIKEPDFIYWIDKKTGYHCKIIRTGDTNFCGHLCGYVGVTKDHPFFKKLYDDEILEGIAVHGGLTFSNQMLEGKDEFWWFGFDCAHAGDLVPFMKFSYGYPYRDIKYVTSQVKLLAGQLKELGSLKSEKRAKETRDPLESLCDRGNMSACDDDDDDELERYIFLGGL